MSEPKSKAVVMSEPREFWIEIGNECDDIVWHKPVNENTVHCIEYSAYLALEEKLRVAEERIKELECKKE